MKKIIVLVSYSFYPNKEVGANRLRFWAQYLENDLEGYQPVVLTATPFADSEKVIREQYYIPLGSAGILGILIKDQGLAWKKNLLNFFRSGHLENIHSVVFSGGPFMHFSIISEVKKLTGAKMVIDFRDPFANNLRFKSAGLKIMIKRFFEQNFVKASDLVVSVNQQCLELLTGYEENSNKFQVLPNGYDHKAFENNKMSKHAFVEGQTCRVVYPGKYYAAVLPDRSFHAMSILAERGQPFQFIHYGGSEIPSALDQQFSFVEEMGPTDYPEIVKGLFHSHIGIIYTDGNAFESSTKIFDYIGAELPILIVTNGELKSGNIHRILMHYPMVKWSANKVEDIVQALKEMTSSPMDFSFPEKARYTRMESLKRLLNWIDP